MNGICEKLNDATARIERVIHLAGAMAATDSFPDDLNDFFDDEDEDDIVKCLGDIPDWVDLSGRGYSRAETIYEWLSNAKKLGFLVKFATPVMTPSGENCREFSWGYYNTAWIYADTMEGAIENVLAWVNERRNDEDAKATAVHNVELTGEPLCGESSDRRERG